MRHIISGRVQRQAIQLGSEPTYVPVSPAAELADLICRSFAGRGVRLKPLEIRGDRFTLAIAVEQEAEAASSSDSAE